MMQQQLYWLCFWWDPSDIKGGGRGGKEIAQRWLNNGIINCVEQVWGMYDSSSEDSKQRPFICPCGKNYLSYPALFTHVKQKHNGSAPGEIIRPKSLNKRGRPRKNIAELPNDLLPPLPDYKNPAHRLFFNRGEQNSPPSAGRESIAKPASRVGYDFIPPIPTSHLSIIKSYHAAPAAGLQQPQRYEPTADNSLAPPLLHDLKALFAPLATANYPSTAILESLIRSNRCYQRARASERRTFRKVSGGGQLEMELQYAVLQFLEVTEDELSKRQFKNLQVLMGLLLAFYLEMLQADRPPTTQTYVKHLNTFIKTLLQEVSLDHSWRQIFALEKHPAMQLLDIFHRWLLTQRLTQHELRINPDFAVQEPEQAQQNQQGSGGKEERSKVELKPT